MSEFLGWCCYNLQKDIKASHLNSLKLTLIYKQQQLKALKHRKSMN